MEFPNLNEKQKFVLNSLKEKIGSDFTEKWLVMRNKHFNNRAPIDYLLSENYNYFDYILSDV